MFPELVTRPDLQVFLPPISGTPAPYLFGDVSKLPDHSTRITCRVTTNATAPTYLVPISAPVVHT
jgi:hypothetical protein